MAIAAEILTHLRAEAGQFKAEIAGAEKSAAGFASSTERAAAVGGAALLGLGAVAVVVGVMSVKAAMEHEQAHARLVTAIRNSGSTWAAQAEAVEHADTKLRNLGFTDTETESSLAKLTNATHDTHKATELMGLASDIARGRHIELGAATDILVKVEAGRVGLLGRLGIQTKDTTGATISQTEAVKRLTDLYGGQAQAYTETLSGKLQVLEAQLEHVGVAIGEFLIPKLTAIGSAVADTITWFTKHQEAAIALAVVIGGPLVYAIGAYVAALAVSAGSSIAAFWSGLAIIVTDILIPSIAGLITWLGSLTVAEAAATAGISLIVAAGVALATGLIKIGGGVSDFVKSADKQADMFIRSVRASGDYTTQMAKLQAQQQSQKNSIEANNRALDEADKAYHTVGANTGELASRIADLSGGLEFHQRVLDAVTGEMKKLNAEHEKGIAKAGEVAAKFGIEIPDAMAKNSKAVKAIQSQLPELIDKYGVMFTQIALNAGVAGGALKALNQDTDQFAKTLEGSISKFTDPFAKFGDQLAVSQADFEAFFVGSQTQAADWANEITGLIQRGVDLGIINQMARAGPGSKPSLDAFVAMVEEHGVDWVNSVYQSGQQAAKATEDAYNAMALSAAIKTAEIAQVTQAYFKALSGGGIEDLVALANSADTNFAKIAVDAIFRLGQVNSAITSVPKDVPVVINIQTAGWNPDVIKQKLVDIVGTYTADVIVNSHGSYDPLGGLTGTGIFGDALLQAWPEAAEQLMHRDALRTPTEKAAAREVDR